MIAIAVWLLISISDGMYNRGDVSTIAQHPTEKDCLETKANLYRQAGSRNQEFYCVPATIITQHG